MTSSTIEIQGFEDLDQDTTSLDILALYYVSDNFGLGITWNYDTTEVFFGGDSIEVTSNEIGPVAAYNISLNKDASLKRIGALLIASIEDDSIFGDEVTIDGNGWAVGGIISNFINDYISVNASLVFESLSLEEDDFDTDVDVGGYTVGVGFLSIFRSDHKRGARSPSFYWGRLKREERWAGRSFLLLTNPLVLRPSRR
ncbi:MAG: hypothetical protein IPK65_06540 [Gammaproteobacteria bacterium]|nr:hypothetical protein [Gammaproteobacteria bacterium]